MGKTLKKSKIEIPSKAKIRVIWEGKPEDYTKERVKRINSYFAEKYNNDNIQVIFKAKKVEVNGKEVEMSVTDNVMDTAYQRKLFKEWLKINSVDVDFDRLTSLDDKVNEKLSQLREVDYRYKNWFIKDLEWSNFLSFGDGNKVSYRELEGITVVESNPENRGGKCVRHNTEIEVEYDIDEVVNILGFLPDELKTTLSKITIKQLDDLYQKYGNLGFKVNTPYGFKKILASDITAKNSKILKIKTKNGLILEGSPNHRVKTSNGKFVHLENLIPNQTIQTINGNDIIDYIEVLTETEDLYDIQVDEVEQYYSNGIVSHNSNMSVDLLLFLFFNTTTKGNTAIKVFNRYRDCDEVKVKGTVNIDGMDYIIERIVTRKLKRGGDEYNVKTDLNFHRVLHDGTIENLEGEQRRETEEFIKKSIGTVDDFLLTIVADANNLEDIIKAKPTEKGRTLSRFIGLEVLEEKENICKEMKTKWSKGLKSDLYDTETLKNEIKTFKTTIETEENSIVTNKGEIILVEKSIKDTVEIKEDLISQKTKIDENVLNLRPQDIEREIENITKKGEEVAKKLKELEEGFKSMSEIEYDDDKHEDLIKESRTLNVQKSGYESDVIKTERLIKELRDGEFCPTCKQALKDVDHTDEVKENENLIIELKDKILEIIDKIKGVDGKITELDGIKKKVAEYDKHVIMIDKTNLELENLRHRLREQRELKKSYEANVENIERNKELDTKILGYSTKITNLERDKANFEKLITLSESNIKTLKLNIEKHTELIETIKIEEEVKVIFDLYIKMLGKNGIVKLIMKSVIPLINSELERLMDGVVNFKLIVDINDKNEVEFLLHNPDKDVEYPIQEGSGLEKTISSLALRVIMSKISCLPKPNIMVLDEVFGKVANVNLEYMGDLFQRISEYVPNIFIITHNPLVKDWSNHIITIKKVDDVSYI